MGTALACTALEELQRPTFATIVHQLQDLRQLVDASHASQPAVIPPSAAVPVTAPKGLQGPCESPQQRTREEHGHRVERDLGEGVVVELECVFSAAADAAKLPLNQKCLSLRDSGPWLVGRQHQPQLFPILVPNETLCSSISRSHFELAWEAPTMWLRKLTPNVLLVNGVPAPSVRVPVAHGTHVALCRLDDGAPFLAFCLLSR